MIDAYQKKYQTRNPPIIIKALSFFEEINFKEPLHIIIGIYKWKSVEKRINQMIKSPAKTFPPFS